MGRQHIIGAVLPKTGMAPKGEVRRLHVENGLCAYRRGGLPMTQGIAVDFHGSHIRRRLSRHRGQGVSFAKSPPEDVERDGK